MSSDSEREVWRPPAWSRRPKTTDDLGASNATVVLVVEDDETLRTSVAKILRTVGYTVIQAESGEDALRLLGTMRFNAMVLDIKLPGIDGISLLAKAFQTPPVVLLSAHKVDDESRRRAGKPIVAHLRKPVAPRQLLDAVATAARPEHLRRTGPRSTPK